MTREGDEIGRGTGRQVSSGPETLPRPLGWPSSSLSGQGSRAPPYVPPAPWLCLLFFVLPCSGDTGSAPCWMVQDSNWLQPGSHIVCVFLSPPVGRTFYREGSLGSGGVGGQGHSGLSVHPWLERLVPKKIAAFYLIPKLGFLSPLRAHLAEWERSPLERLAASNPEPLRLSEPACASGGLPCSHTVWDPEGLQDNAWGCMTVFYFSI